MPRSSVGVYSLPTSSFQPRTPILATQITLNFSDIGTALTQSLATTGVSSMTGPLRLASGAVTVPSLCFASETSSGFYLIGNNNVGFSILSTLRYSFTLNDFNLNGIDLLLNDCELDIDLGDATINGDLLITGETDVAEGDIIVSGEIIDQDANNVYAQPYGMIIKYGGISQPPKWLLCNGQAVSRATYANLFSAIGTTFGAGDTSTTFNLPDYRGRVAAGDDAMGASAANRLTGAQSGGCSGTIGNSGGEQQHTITIAELALHQHTYTSTQFIANRGIGASLQMCTGQGTGNTGNAGSGNPHNNIQPTLVTYFLIYAGV